MDDGSAEFANCHFDRSMQSVRSGEISLLLLQSNSLFACWRLTFSCEKVPKALAALAGQALSKELFAPFKGLRLPLLISKNRRHQNSHYVLRQLATSPCFWKFTAALKAQSISPQHSSQQRVLKALTVTQDHNCCLPIPHFTCSFVHKQILMSHKCDNEIHVRHKCV